MTLIRRIDAGAWPPQNEGFVFRDWIKGRHAGQTLIEFYTSVHPASANLSQWEVRIRNGQVAVNDVEAVEPTRVLRVGDVVSYRRLPWVEPPSPCHVDVVYEDADMVALSKPSGLQVLPAAMFHQRTVLSLLRRVYGGGDSGAGGGGSGEAARAGPGAAAGAEAGADVGRGAVVAGGPAGVAGDAACACSCSSEAKAQGGGAQQAKKERQARQQRQRQYLDVPAPVHRLGRGTSGLLLCARTTAARRRLTELMISKTAAAAAAAAGTLLASNSASRSPTTLPEATSLASDSDREAGNTAAADASGAAALAALISSAPASGSGCQLPLRKFYRALVQGRVKADQGRVDVPIGPIPHPGVDRGLFAATPDGKPAASVWRVLERRPGPGQGPPPGAGAAAAADAGAATTQGAEALAAQGPVVGAATAGQAAPAVSAEAGCMEAECTLMEVEILTGRPHQIRIHMAAMGHPLVGDPLYGAGGRPKVGMDAAAALADEEGGDGGSADPGEGGYGRPGDCGYYLHSLELHLPHPITGQPLRLRAPPPPLLMTTLERQEILAVEGLESRGREDGRGP